MQEELKRIDEPDIIDEMNDQDLILKHHMNDNFIFKTEEEDVTTRNHATSGQVHKSPTTSTQPVFIEKDDELEQDEILINDLDDIIEFDVGEIIDHDSPVIFGDDDGEEEDFSNKDDNRTKPKNGIVDGMDDNKNREIISLEQSQNLSFFHIGRNNILTANTSYTTNHFFDKRDKSGGDQGFPEDNFDDENINIKEWKLRTTYHLRTQISELSIHLENSKSHIESMKQEYRDLRAALTKEEEKCQKFKTKMKEIEEYEAFTKLAFFSTQKNGKMNNKSNNDNDDTCDNDLNKHISSGNPGLDHFRNEKLKQLKLENQKLARLKHQLQNEKIQLEKLHVKKVQEKDTRIQHEEEEIRKLNLEISNHLQSLREKEKKIEWFRQEFQKVEKQKQDLDQTVQKKKREAQGESIKMEREARVLTQQLREAREAVQHSRSSQERIKHENDKLLLQIGVLKERVDDKGAEFALLKKKMREKMLIAKESEKAIVHLKRTLSRQKRESEEEKMKFDHVKQNTELKFEALKNTLQIRITELQKQQKLMIVKYQNQITKIKKEKEEHVRNICKKLLVEKKQLIDTNFRLKTQLQEKKKKSQIFDNNFDYFNHTQELFTKPQTQKEEENNDSSLEIQKLLILEQRKNKQKKEELLEQVRKNTELEEKMQLMRLRNDKMRKSVLEKHQKWKGKNIKMKEYIHRVQEEREENALLMKQLQSKVLELKKTVEYKDRQIIALKNQIKHYE